MNSISIARRFRAAAVASLGAASVGGCYVMQSAQGQLAVMSRREPIARVIERPATPARVRTQLEQVTAIRDFASRDLGLPDNGSYRSYADLGRPYVLWNVFAAPEFSVNAKQWCYPIVGCVAYRGYFRESKARAFAAGLRGRGMDVAVGGVAAYSTLGHFDDPILNTMLAWDDIELASIVFHELTHQLLYVPGDSSFNEALATLVEEEGVRRWLTHEGRGPELAVYLQQQQRLGQVIELLIGARTELSVLYASGLQPPAMRERKKAEFAALKLSYARLRADWGANAPFAGWFAQDLNNAHLVSIATYRRCVPGFAHLLKRSGGDLPAFFRKVHELAKLKKAQRDAAVCG